MICRNCGLPCQPQVWNAWDVTNEEPYEVFECPNCGEQTSEEGDLFEDA